MAFEAQVPSNRLRSESLHRLQSLSAGLLPSPKPLMKRTHSKLVAGRNHVGGLALVAWVAMGAAGWGLVRGPNPLLTPAERDACMRRMESPRVEQAWVRPAWNGTVCRSVDQNAARIVWSAIDWCGRPVRTGRFLRTPEPR